VTKNFDQEVKAISFASSVPLAEADMSRFRLLFEVKISVAGRG
jgi:hypothetical protein